jgi:hypothetical protein
MKPVLVGIVQEMEDEERQDDTMKRVPDVRYSIEEQL